MKDDTNSLRNFPVDLVLASGIPIILAAIATSWLLTRQGWQWIAAFSAALLVAVAGALYMFRAKLPLYRQHRFFHVWFSRPPCILHSALSDSLAFEHYRHHTGDHASALQRALARDHSCMPHHSPNYSMKRRADRAL